MIAAGFQRVRFADPARDMLAAGFGLSADDIDGQSRERSQRRFGGNSVQFLMSSLIEEWGRRAVHTDLFNHEYRRRVEALASAAEGPVSIVTEDVRRPGEAATIRDMGGIVVRITRPGYVPSSPHGAAKMAHIEADLEFVIRSPDMLIAQTDAFLKSLDRPEAA